jgi:tetratricopeptide (TPR) repeat protein
MNPIAIGGMLGSRIGWDVRPAFAMLLASGCSIARDGGFMRISFLGWLVVFSFLGSLVLAQDQPDPARKAEGEPGKEAPKTMKLYDVPAAREASSEPPEEVADYFKITQTQDSSQRAVLIEDFLKKYPESKYNPTLHQLASSVYQQLNNYEKLVEHGEKSLQVLPSSPALLSVLALAYAYHGEADKAIDRASRSITILEKLTMPANADAARFTADRNQYLASNYACLGSAFLTKFESARKARQESTTAAPATPDKTEALAPAASSSKPAEPVKAGSSSEAAPAENPETIHLAKSQGYLTRALELNSSYEFAQFQVGVVYAYQNRPEMAMEAFARTIALGGSFTEMGRQNLEAIYKATHKNSLEGLEEFLAKTKTAETPTKATETPLSPPPK